MENRFLYLAYNYIYGNQLYLVHVHASLVFNIIYMVSFRAVLTFMQSIQAIHLASVMKISLLDIYIHETVRYKLNCSFKAWRNYNSRKRKQIVLRGPWRLACAFISLCDILRFSFISILFNTKLTSFIWDMGKQCGSRSGATECGV